MESATKSIAVQLHHTADGVVTAFIRLSLVAALGVIASGLFRLPDTVTNSGELVIGGLLAFAVSFQMLLAAIFFPVRTEQQR